MPAAPAPAGAERRDREIGQEGGRLRGGDDERLARSRAAGRVRGQEPPGRGAHARAQARLPRGGLGARAQHAVEPVPEPLERAGVEQREAVGDRLHGRSDALQRDVQPVGPQAHRERVGRARAAGPGRARGPGPCACPAARRRRPPRCSPRRWDRRRRRAVRAPAARLPWATPCSCAATARSNRGMWTPTSIGGRDARRTYVRLQAGARLPMEAGCRKHSPSACSSPCSSRSWP